MCILANCKKVDQPSQHLGANCKSIFNCFENRCQIKYLRFTQNSLLDHKQKKQEEYPSFLFSKP